MGAKLLEDTSQFADYLLSIEDSRVEQHNEKGYFFIKLPDDITVTNEKELLDFVFGGIEDKYPDSAWLAARSAICPTNVEVDAINKTIREAFPGEKKV
ncbi:hypothetical protein ElyMa_003812100 [Elysia marginata]|uniref:DNA helicase n=1 Tax=Elysia marginata TaxID=1093978 RepID=A0AAV4FDL6_9GAST|nr:hypothetical protein ElyMa_003812100 [Elysia marginata]